MDKYVSSKTIQSLGGKKVKCLIQHTKQTIYKFTNTSQNMHKIHKH